MWFFKSKKEIKKVDVLYENKIVLDDKVLNFPLSLKDIEEILGKPNRMYQANEVRMKYIYDELGIVFGATLSNIKKFYKSCNINVDDNHNINSIILYLGKTVIPANYEKDDELPSKTCNAMVMFEGNKPYFWGGSTYISDFWIYYGENIDGEIKKLNNTLSIHFSPKPIKKPANYKIKNNIENALHFDNLNFKLAIIQVLMYDLEILKPYFDIYDFAEQYKGKEIDTESETIIKPALNFFKKLPIPKELATKVEEIYMDGGNDIYMNIIPQWDGEDGVFDINEITLLELKQFSNLKKATIMSSNFDKVGEIFKLAGVDVKLL